MIGPKEKQISDKIQSLLTTGQVQAALLFLEEKIQLGIASKHCLTLQLQICIKLNRHEQCLRLFEQLINLNPLERNSYYQLATFKEHLGDLTGAINVYQRLLEIHATSADTYFNMAIVQKRAERFEDALSSYQKSLELNISQPEEVWLNIAVIYSDHLLQADKAEKSLKKALGLNPNYIPALLNLGNLYEEMGNKKAAKNQYERIIAIDPNYVDALARLANVTDIKDANDPLVHQINSAAKQPGIPDLSRSSLYFSLGRLLDSVGSFDQAFAAYSAANKIAHNNGSVYKSQAQQEEIDNIITTFSADWFQRLKPVSDETPLFICGMFRSGSTLIEQVLAAHPDIEAAGEQEFFPRLAAKKIKPFPQAITKIPDETLSKYAEQYSQTIKQLYPSAQIITDKRPDNFLYIGLIKTLFPKARVIYTTRHALDNCLSVYFLQLTHQMGYASNLLDTGHYYLEHKRLMQHWRSLFSNDICEVNYDAFVVDPETQLRKLLDFCGVPWDSQCLDFHNHKSFVKTASYWQVREPLYTRSSGRWHNYKNELAALSEYLTSNGVKV